MSVRRTMLAVAASGNKIYAIGGWNDSDYSGLIDVVEEYSVYNNSWATKTNLNYPVSESAIAAVNGRIYIAGGNESSLNGIPSNRMLMYYPFLDSVSLNYQNAIPVMQSNTTPLGIVSVSF
jgi:hypothetical protein